MTTKGEDARALPRISTSIWNQFTPVLSYRCVSPYYMSMSIHWNGTESGPWSMNLLYSLRDVVPTLQTCIRFFEYQKGFDRYHYMLRSLGPDFHTSIELDSY